MTTTHGIWTIAALETRRYLPFSDWRPALALVLVAITIGLSWPAVQDQGIDPARDLYTVEVEGNSPYLAAIDRAVELHAIEGDGDAFQHKQADLFVSGVRVLYDQNDDRSRAAARAFDRAVDAWLDARLAIESDQDAAYPVQVRLVFESRTLIGSPGVDEATEPTQTPTPTQPSEDDDGNQTARPDDNGTQPTEDVTADNSTGTLGGRAGGDVEPQSPDQIEPPFPIRSLLLTFAFVIPWSFLAQILSGSILHERLGQRGLILLSAPWSGRTVLAGLTLPYVVLGLIIAVGVSIAIGASWVGMLAMMPVMLLLFSASVLTGIVARSQREMTFLLVTITTGLSTFLFLPAMFIQVHPVAFASPVAVVSNAIRGVSVDWASFLYATAPITLAGGALVVLSAALFREEYLFSPSRISSKVIDAVHNLTRGPFSLTTAGVLTVPFAFIAQIFVLVVAVMLELRVAFLVFLFGSAFVEEALKGLVAYGHIQRDPERARHPVLVGGTIGLGFFIGEKMALLIALVGFGLLPQGGAILRTFGVGGGAMFLVLPLLLHAGAATITAYGARRGRRGAIIGFWLAGIVHVAYNASILFLGAGK